MKGKKQGKGARQTMTAAVVVVIALLLLVFLLSSQVLRVRNIIVVGNRHLLREEVITQSGVEIGDHLLGRSVAQMGRNLEKNRYIDYQGFEFDYKGTLTIRMEERLGGAVVSVLGVYYVLDKAGMVLEVAGSRYPDTVAGPKVTGFAISENSRVVAGEAIPAPKEQIAQMQTILTALEQLGMLSRISQLDVTSFDNLYLMTSDSARIELGDDSYISTKLLIAKQVLSLHEPMGDLRGAKIDVSSGRNAHFIPSTLPTPTPVPTATPTIAPSSTPGR